MWSRLYELYLWSIFHLALSDLANMQALVVGGEESDMPVSMGSNGPPSLIMKISGDVILNSARVRMASIVGGDFA